MEYSQILFLYLKNSFKNKEYEKNFILYTALYWSGCLRWKNNNRQYGNTKHRQYCCVETITELPPLAEGEVFLKEQDPFGEAVELKGTHITNVDTFIFKPREPFHDNERQCSIDEKL